MKHIVIGASFLTSLMLLNACTVDDHSVSDSDGLATNSITEETHVSYTGSQVVTIETKLRDGSNTDVNLVSGDTLKVSTVGDPSHLNFSDNLFDRLPDVADQVKVMQQGSRRVYDQYVSGLWYYATIDAKYRDKEFTVALLRDRQNDAPNSVVTLPPEFTISIDEMQSLATLSRSAPMTVRWTPANPGYTMKVSVFVNCSNGTKGKWDSGSFVNQAPNPLDNYQIPTTAYAGYSGECIVTVGVENSQLNAADASLGPGSTIQSHQYRTIAVTTME